MKPSTSRKYELPNIIGDKYRVVKKIGSGSFGHVHMGICLESGEKVAIKTESRNARRAVLAIEASIYQTLVPGTGIPNIHYHGTEDNVTVLVMDLLGPSLEDLYKLCKRRFSLKTILMLMDQMITRLEFVHQKGFIHRDLKPDNFLMGIGPEAKTLFLIDFGLGAAYRNPETRVHVPFNKTSKIIGSTRYSSMNANAGIEQSRRDDMESLGYVMIYFMRGALPWQGIAGFTKSEKREKILEKKMSTTVDELCKDCPAEFAIYMNYCRHLIFEKQPNYMHLRKIFSGLARKLRFQNDDIYDWTFLLDETVSDESESSVGTVTDETTPTSGPKEKKNEKYIDRAMERHIKLRKDDKREKRKKIYEHERTKGLFPRDHATTSKKLHKEEKNDMSISST